jgi:leader peptidase (prepilin peptidase)/N-methyltransferase
MKIIFLFFFPILAGPLPGYFPLLLGYLFLTGAALGSFLNVCIYRIPLGLSLIRPGSYCATCGRPIPVRYNIPIFGWLWLRGRSACCRNRIDARYMWVELAAAVLLPLLFLRFPWQMALPYALFLGLLAVGSLIDIDHFLIPDRISLGGVGAGLACGALFPVLHGQTTAVAGFDEALRGAFWGGALLWIVVVAGSKVLKKEAMGLGDVKFLGCIGAFLGWQSVLFVVAVSSIFGSLYGLLLLLRRQKVWGTRIPYGPFLALAALLWIFGGRQIAILFWAWWIGR